MSADALRTRLPLDAFDASCLEAKGILPLELVDGKLRVAADGTPDVEVLDDLERCFDAPVVLVPASGEDILEGIRRAYAAESMVELVRDLGETIGRGDETGETPLADVRHLANQPPVIRYVNALIREAHESRASDIHLESTRSGLRCRLRIDGVLSELPTPPAGLEAAIVSRVKLIADLDIAERRRPNGERQDDDALRRARAEAQRRGEDHHDRGSGGISPRGRHAGARPRAGRDDLRLGPAQHAPAGPRRGHGGRNARRRHGPDRGAGIAHRSPRVLDAPHQRCGVRHSPAHGPRRGAVPRGRDARGGSGAAARAQGLYRVPRAV